jgi:hypothetical protein
MAMNTKSKWLGWKPDTPILEKTPRYELTKPTKPPSGVGSVSFGGSPLREFQKIGPDFQSLDDDKSATLLGCKAKALAALAEDAPVSGTPQDSAPEDLARESAVLGQAGQPSEPTTLKGQAVELWREGHRYFVVADEADAQETMRRLGARRGEVWTGAEIELVASIPDQASRDEIEAFKRQLDGCISPGTAGKCLSAAEWQAQMLNQLFKEQGVLGQPGKITAATVRHGEQTESEGKAQAWPRNSE